MFEFTKSGQSLLKNVFGKGKVPSGNKILRGHRKTPTETHKYLEESAKDRNVSRFLVFKWQIRFSYRTENVMDDVQEERPSHRNSRAVQNEVRDVIDVDRRLTVREVAVFQRLG